ncbi:MAG: ATP-binding protein [Henriciella sp.]|nr:ATP-binding protein [Henriciella sp.]
MGLTYGVGEQKPATGVNVRNVHLGAKALWSKSLEAMQAKTTPDNSQQWLTDLRFVAEVNNAIVVAAPDQLTLDRVIASFERPLQQAWQDVDPKRRKLKFELWSRIPADVRDVVGDPWLNESAFEADAEFGFADGEDGEAAIGHAMTFSTLVTGPSNARAVGLGKRLAKGAPIPAGVIVIYGEPGTGKTHILKAVEAETARKDDGRRLAYISAEEFMTRFVNDARAGDTSALQSYVKQNDLLMIDDLHWIAGKAKTDKAFFGALRAVTSMGGHVIITADAAPGDMVGLSKELAGEIKGAASVEVAMPDDEMRKAIIRRHVELIAKDTPNFALTDAMVDRIVATIRGAGRELCGVLWSLQLETGYGELAPTPEMLETVIRRIAGEPRTPTLDEIKRTCMDVYRISKTDIESSSKVRTICHPRQVAMYLSRVMTDKSFPQIATAYKKKDHTTVLHAYRKIKQALDKGDRDMSDEIERVKNAVFDRLAGHD